MSERPENPSPPRGANWHTPTTPSPWKPSQAQEQRPKAVWREVSALPKDMNPTPQSRGLWHLPQPEHTTYKPTDTVQVSDTPKPSPSGSIRPEELIQQIIGTRSQTPITRPEDLVPRYERPAKPAPVDDEEMGEETIESQPLQEDIPTQAMGELEALGALDDEDDEDFSMSELVALASLEQDAQAGSPFNPESDTVQIGDLSPAERALYNIASSVDLPQDTLSMTQSATMMGDAVDAGATQTLDDTQNDAASYAARMAKQFAQDQGETIQLTPTQQQPAIPQLTPEQQQLAQQFRDTKRQVQALRQQYQAGQMDRGELERRLQQHTILDPQSNWWMIGVETDKWYRYDNMSGQWLEENPPVPLDTPSPRTETGTLDPNQVIAGSLPYLPTGSTVPPEVSDSYDPNQYANAQHAFSSQYGSQDTPIPRPGAPTIDPNMTQVGSAFDATTLSSAEQTLQNLNVVDANDFGSTMPSASQYGNFDTYDQQAPQYQTTAPDYNLEGAVAPTFEDARAGEQRNLLLMVGLGFFALFACGVVSVIGFFAYAMYWYNDTVEPYRAEIAALANYQPDFQVARIIDANGDVIVELTGGEGRREPVSIERNEVSPYFIHAIVSSEDPTFYENSGFQVLSIARAFWQNLTAGEIQSGASSITQQIARNLILQDTTVSAERKATELVIALEIAQNYSKNQVLDIYINEFFYGNQNYGVEAASQFYFNHEAATLNMAEASMLVGILPSPAATNPVANQVESFRNMRVVIDRMIRTNCLYFQHGTWGQTGEPFCINAESLVDDGGGGRTRLLTVNPDGTYGGLLATQLALVETRNYAPRGSDLAYPHFVNFIVGQVEATYGPGALYQRGFTIYTTLVPRIQRTAEQALRDGVANLRLNGAETGAVLVMDPVTGAIRALVGSPDFSNADIDGQVDNTRTYQQPGSAIKPILYTAAINGTSPNGYYTPASVLWDVPSQYNINGQVYAPTNFDRLTRGPIPLRFALQQSLNIPAVKTYEFVGQETFVQVAESLGLNFLPEATFGLPSALGSNEVRLMDLVHAYGTLANDGRYVPIYAIERITENVSGQEVEVPLPARTEPYQAVSPQVAYVMQNILSDDAARSTPINGVNSSFSANSAISGAGFGLPNQGYVAAKTGTTNGPTDIWSVGFTNNWAVGVWIGTVNNTPMTGGASGAFGAAPVFNAVLREALNGRNPGEFTNPGGVVQDNICRLTGTLAPLDSGCPQRVVEIYVQGQQPPNASQGFVQTINIDSWTGLRANQWCTENVVSQTYGNISDPFALPWLTGTATGRQFLSLLGLPQTISAAPTGECQQGQALPTVRITFPGTGAVASTDIAITGQISAPDLQRWEVLVAPTNTDNFTPITQANTQQVQTAGTELTRWNTRTVTNGQYTIRLAAYSTSGGYIFRDVPVVVENIAPTSTPQPTFTPTDIVPAGFTPLPFDNPSGPTPTVDPLG